MDPPGGSAPGRQRARRACLSCRLRKIKCDAVEVSPCTNCRQDGSQCVVPRVRRSRKLYLGHVGQTVETYPTDTFPVDTSQTSLSTSTIDIDRRVSVDSDYIGMYAGANSDRESSGQAVREDTDFQTSGSMAVFDTPNATILDMNQAPSSPFDLPDFIKPPSMASDPGYAQFLNSQGAVRLVPLMLQCALVRAFVEYVYPRMPLLDLEDFSRRISSVSGACGKVPLMLYQAILFAGAAHVELEVITTHNYADRRCLRRELYQRAELLYDLNKDYEPLVVIQTALLLTCRGVSEQDRKDSWYWVNLAISSAYAIGLHRHNEDLAPHQPESRLLRRLWWCCFVRDSILALGLNRPTRIKEQDFDVPMLELADMEFDLLSTPLPILGQSHVSSVGRYRQLESAELCIQKTKLCVIMNQILQLNFVQLSAQGSGEQSVLDRSSKHWRQVDILDAALRSWHQSLPRSCRYRRLKNERHEPGSNPIDVRRHLLQMSYHTAVYTLHRPRFLPDNPRNLRNDALTEEQETSKELVMSSANHITLMAAELNQEKMDDNLPITAITVICPALFTNLLNMKSQRQDIRSQAVCSFRVCMRIMENLQTLYSAAEVTVKFLEVALQKASGAGLLMSGVKAVFQLNKQDRTDIASVLSRSLNKGKRAIGPSPVTIPTKDKNDGGERNTPSAFFDLDFLNGSYENTSPEKNISSRRTSAIASVSGIHSGVSLHEIGNLSEWMEDADSGWPRMENCTDGGGLLGSDWEPEYYDF